MDVRTATQTGDEAAMRGLLAEDPARAANSSCGVRTAGFARIRCTTYPTCCEGTLERGKEMPFIEAPLKAGADCNHQATNGETPLIGGASLGAEEVGLRLLEAGAQPDACSLFFATPAALGG